MTLAEWVKRSPYAVSVHRANDGNCTSVWLPDFYETERCEHRAKLWRLSDYRVTSVCGGSIWLAPRVASE